MPDGRVEFEITADGRKAYASIESITEELRKSGVKWEKNAKTATDSIGASFEGTLKKIVAGFSAAKIGQMLLNIGKDAIQAASDLQEVQNVVDVTFGDAGAQKIEKWAKAAGDQFGLTETQAKKFTSTLGAMMKSAGMTGDEIVDISTDLSGLAADMASFYNLDFDTAFQKIRSGISGETEPLKQLGINMSEANLNAFALQQGLQKTFAEMTQGEKTILRYQYLMQATSDAQGDFARTSDGFANATRKLETNIESLKAKLGEVLLPVVNEVIGGINTMLDTLTKTHSKTVLDEFAEIDLKTQEKIDNIKATSEKARTLTDVLDGIGKNIGDNKTKAGEMLDNVPDGKSGKLQDLIKSLEGVGEQAGTDKTAIAGMDDDAPDGKSGKLQDLTKSLEGVETQAGADKTAIAGMDDDAPDGSALDPFTDVIKGLGGFALETQEAISGILSPTEAAAEDNALWLETCQELVKTLPGLNDIIDTQTGEIKGGTQAVRDYIDAWEKAQIGVVLQGAHEQKRGALESKFSELPGLELDKTVAEYRLRKQREAIQQMADNMGVGVDFDRLMMVGGNQPNMWTPEQKALNEAIQSYYNLNRAAIEARDAYQEQKDAYDEAVLAYEEEGRVIQETYGKAIEAVDAWTEAQQTAATEAVDAFGEALKAVEDYYTEVRNGVASSVGGNISGFAYIKTAAEQAKDAANEFITFEEALDRTKYTAEQLESVMRDANKQITAQSMKQALESQLAFIEEYKKNLDDVKNSGLIDETILAQLSDGSNESAQYLHAMAEAARSGDTQTLTELNNAWKQVNEGKETFIDALTQQKLAVDEQYDAMVAKAEEAAKALDVSTTAGESTGKNIAAMAQAIKDHVPGITEQVDAVLAQLNRLNEWGVTIDYGFGGSTVIKPGATSGKGASITPLAVGMDWIPFDGFLASLHEGEAVLTAEENRVWQQFKNNQRGVDYDTLGGVMRDSIKPGGNVYLDGRVVGSVISQMQGNQYRAMQRSGWQQ